MSVTWIKSLDATLIVLLALALTGVLLLVVALLFLLRKRRPGDSPVAATVYLSHPAPSAPAVLPEKTLLGNGRYRILNVQAASETVNVYAARGTAPINRCPRCDTAIEGDEVQFCTHCGTDLSHVTLVYPKFLVRETAEAQALSESSQLVALHLSHPALILPVDVFMETAFGPLRYYRVEPAIKRSVEAPYLLDKVLAWGIALAQGMAYVHQRYVVLRHVDAEHVVIEDGRASFVCIDNARILPQDAYAQAASDFAENVRALARLLLTWLHGASAAGQEVQSSVSVVALLTQAQETGMSADALATSLEQALYQARAHRNVRFQIGCQTDVGRVRSLNEDSVLARDFSERFQALGAPVGVFAVADGMGGHAAGDVASQLIISTLIEETANLDTLADKEALFPARAWLEQAVMAANQAVHAHRKAADNDMGSTLVLALVTGAHVIVANMGDSRAYHLTEDGARQITTDHSLVERLVAVGQITAQEAREHPRRNVIYRVVGDKPKPEFDLFEQLLAPGEAVLLCSDGLSGMVPDAQIWQMWRDAPSPQAACDRLVEAANRAGGTDNISVVIVQIVAV
ncbi:MAG TPA: Stp1/IreP family PP2C-type Ser/Thr phosphatase [Anaerolineae bacterium]|nr:Stp1/IreP family PP2C-type Ser/Thr phosphatase [Anaerolineae bacterium]HQI83655.1 Stp1/IreP family PP2C-type Ser/Thr phosphatase [Anaerolineae bacterium]